MPNHELELTNKGRRALESMDIDIPVSRMPRGYKHTLLHVLAMTQNGMDLDEMVEEYIRTTVIESGETFKPSLARFMLDAVIKLLIVTEHLKYAPYEDEEPPEFMSDFKDHF